MNHASCARAAADSCATRRDIAIHAEYAIGREQRRAACARLQPALGIIGIRMAVALELRGGEARAIEQRGMVQAVLQHGFVRGRQRR